MGTQRKQSTTEQWQQEQPKMKMKIVFDEDKIRREGKYDIDKMYASVDKSFADWGIPKIGRGVYQSSGKQKDYSRFMSFCMGLSDVGWFVDNISDWIWENNGNDQDVIKSFRKYQVFNV
ncbi:hypothetical protein FACS1894133_3400 [Clostridia bacterium]|nr:hypothetical protein FACS1894133_3400 [Clostridia bacterium]